MKTPLAALTVLLTGTAIVAAVALPQGAEASPSVLSPLTPQPASMQAGLCGMTQAKVLDIRDDYGLDFTAAEAANALQTPFNCDAYDELCDQLLPADARDYACGVWQALDDQRPVDWIVNAAHAALTANGQSCQPDESMCDDACASQGGWSTCEGVILAGACRTYMVCNTPELVDMEGFTILHKVDLGD